MPNPFLLKLNSSDGSLYYLRNSTFISLINEDHSKTDLLDWLSSKIKELGYEGEERARVKNQTTRVHNKAVFHRIEPGYMEYENEFWIELSEPFEMQSTHVTQGQWVEIMGVNPSVNKTPSSLIELNHPVENITVWSAMEFANRLSVREGLEPVYDLSGLEFSGSPEQGSYRLEGDYRKAIKINHPDNDIYKTKGYRLPTLAEYFMVITDRGEYSDQREFEVFFRDSDYDFKDFFNFSGMVPGRMIESASLRPFLSNGHEFYDLLGNVFSFTSDTFFTSDNMPRGQNPSNTRSLGVQIDINLFGQSYKSISSEMREHLRIISMDLNHRVDAVGFRLVRSLDQ